MSFFNTTHSIPDSLGICIHTSYGSIVYTGEFKFDQSLHGQYAPDMKRMAEIGDEGVFALISDSTEAENLAITLLKMSLNITCMTHSLKLKEDLLFLAMHQILFAYNKF